MVSNREKKIYHEEDLEQRITRNRELQRSKKETISNKEGYLSNLKLNLKDPNWTDNGRHDIRIKIYDREIELKNNTEDLKNYKIQEQNLLKELTESQGYISRDLIG